MLDLKKWCRKYPLLCLIGKTPMAKITLFEKECPDVSIYAKCEYTNPGGSLKDRPARHMLLNAIEEGILTPDKTILDSTSGNAGVAYAAIGAMMGFAVELVAPGNISIERKKRIKAHGAVIHETDPIEGYDEALKEVRRRYEQDKERYFFADQYRNKYNWLSHFETTAPEILEETPKPITHFIAGVGTGGTITGCGRRLKERDKNIRVILADAEDFPGIEGLKPLTPGHIIPEIFDREVVDGKVSVGIEEAAGICRKLASQGLFVGQSSGAYLYAVFQTAKEIKKGCIVTLLNDIGERYFSTRLWD